MKEKQSFFKVNLNNPAVANTIHPIIYPLSRSCVTLLKNAFKQTDSKNHQTGYSC